MSWLQTARYLLGVVSKQLRLLHGQVGDSTTSVNFLSPQMSELVEHAVASWCGDTAGHFWLIRNALQKFVELKFEFFSFKTFDVSLIFWQRVVQTRPKYSYCIFLKGLCWVSVCWILNNALCSMSWVFPGFYFVPHCPINIWYHMLCYLPNIKDIKKTIREAKCCWEYAGQEVLICTYWGKNPTVQVILLPHLWMCFGIIHTRTLLEN